MWGLPCWVSGQLGSQANRTTRKPQKQPNEVTTTSSGKASVHAVMGSGWPAASTTFGFRTSAPSWHMEATTSRVKSQTLAVGAAAHSRCSCWSADVRPDQIRK
mmetsp:Transcript_66571/g.184324  ORF Transcript_66571/g.184324 Transcript_66571/m.184324 type:complete len:103 (+) Transcript_66571:167-475(+)